VGIGSPLVFGKALDEALNVLLLRKKDNLSPEELEYSKKNPLDIFNDLMVSEGVLYLKSDLDEDLLTEEFRLNNKWEPSKLSHHSLLQKGKMILEEYENSILPRIIKVHSIQKEGELLNAEGDILTSKTDFIADWEEVGNTVLFDNKTSGKRYLGNSVSTSYQLSIYSEAENIQRCGYIVMGKKILKRRLLTCRSCKVITERPVKSCPAIYNKKRCDGVLDLKLINKVDIQVIVDDIPEETKQFVFEDIKRHAEKIKDEKFEKNLNSCYQYGRKCPFYSYCHENKSMVGLTKLDDSDTINKKGK